MKFKNRHFYCEICDDHLVCTDIEKIDHINNCQNNKNIKNSDQSNNDKNKVDIIQKTMICDICQTEINGSTLDLLRHKSSHN